MSTREQGAWTRFEKLADSLSGVTGVVGGLAILASAVIITEGVIIRKAFGMSTTWQIEMAVFLLIYACFMGAPLGQKNDSHINVDMIIIHMRPPLREKILLVALIVACLISAVLAYYAWPMWWKALVKGEHSESLWGPPLWIPYLFLPLGMTLLTVQQLAQVTRKFRQIKSGDIHGEAVRSELKDIELPGSGQGGRP